MTNYTRIPNDFIDNLKLNPYQFQILSIIVRKTDGWCKVEDGISLSQFEKLVTFSKNTIIKTIKELQELNLIEVVSHFDSVRKIHSYNTYKISQGVVQEMNKGSAGDEQGVVQEMNKQKKTNTKETKTNNTLDDVNQIYTHYKDNIKSSKSKQSAINNIVSWLKEYKKEIMIQSIDNYKKSIVGQDMKYFKDCKNFFGVKDESKGYFIDFIDYESNEVTHRPKDENLGGYSLC